MIGTVRQGRLQVRGSRRRWPQLHDKRAGVAAGLKSGLGQLHDGRTAGSVATGCPRPIDDVLALAAAAEQADGVYRSPKDVVLRLPRR